MAKSKLGKGVDVLFQGQHTIDAVTDSHIKITNLDPRLLKPNPNQPRRNFDESALNELAASIKEYGLIQPVIAEKNTAGEFIIVAGERRTRAACLLDLAEIPVIVMSAEIKERAELALIENIQREDLNPIEEANAFRTIMDIRGYSQDELAKRIGKSRPAVANALRLLKLPEHIQEALTSGTITAGHARALLSVISLTEQTALFDNIVRSNLSVREAEAQAAALHTGKQGNKKTGKKKGAKNAPQDAAFFELKHIEQRFIDSLGTKVQIKGSLDKGIIEISYFSKDNLDEILTSFHHDGEQ